MSSVRRTNQNQIAVVLVLVVLPIIQQDELMKWHQRGVTCFRIRVIRVNFSEILIKGKELSFELARVRVNRVKMTENWDKIQEKWDFIRVIGVLL